MFCALVTSGEAREFSNRERAANEVALNEVTLRRANDRPLVDTGLPREQRDDFRLNLREPQRTPTNFRNAQVF